jgi:hypothetical protein
MSALYLEALTPPAVGGTVLSDVKAVGMLADMIEGKPGLRRGDAPACRRKSNIPMGEAKRSSSDRAKITEKPSPGP